MLTQISCPRGALPDIDAELDPYPEEYSIQARPDFFDNATVRGCAWYNLVEVPVQTLDVAV